jgi:NAD(P)-dependent dehydrogenase (short-subunit alcohol dehydrogenase family)
MIDVNLKGICQSFGTASLFTAQRFGILIKLGPIDSEVSLAYQASYSASKAGVRSLDDALAQDLRLARLNDVRVVTVEPWATDTPWRRHAANYRGGTPRMAAMDDPRKITPMTEGRGIDDGARERMRREHDARKAQMPK